MDWIFSIYVFLELNLVCVALSCFFAHVWPTLIIITILICMDGKITIAQAWNYIYTSRVILRAWPPLHSRTKMKYEHFIHYEKYEKKTMRHRHADGYNSNISNIVRGSWWDLCFFWTQPIQQKHWRWKWYILSWHIHRQIFI